MENKSKNTRNIIGIALVILIGLVVWSMRNTQATWKFEKLGLVESNIPVKIGEETFMVGGDIILGIDGISLAETNGYVKIKNHLNSLPKGSKVTLQILRAGIKRELTFKKER